MVVSGLEPVARAIAASLWLDSGYRDIRSRCRRLRSGRNPVKPDDAVYLACGGVWPGARCAGDRSLALARQRLQGYP
ncbi:hypothetical protein EMIT051CA3_60067 [Pseudomonas chlororaphis]